MNVQVASRAPFSFDLALAYLHRRAGELVDRAEQGRYRRLLLIDERPLLVQAQNAGTTSAPALAVSLLNGDRAYLPVVADRVRLSFGLDDDLVAFRTAVAGDPTLCAIIDRNYGLRLVRTQSPFEALVWAIIGQQITLTFAFRLKSMLVMSYGESLQHDADTYWAFPTPERLAEVAPETLAASGLGRRKAATIANVAQRVADGRLDLAELRAWPREQAAATLTALHGIGPWTAAYTLLRGLGDAGVCPTSDVGLRAAVGRYYDGGGLASMTRMQALSERWGEWRGYAAFYLWNAGYGSHALSAHRADADQAHRGGHHRAC